MKLSLNSPSVKTKATILYVHGMGGGSDSRIPSILRDCFSDDNGPDVVVRTYDFDPGTAQRQLLAWIQELQPSLLIGESLGAVHALSLSGSMDKMPVILVSPAMNAPRVFHDLAFLSLIPGVRRLLNRIYEPKPGDRQKIDFHYKLLRKWKPVRENAVSAADHIHPFAFFGIHDHYRRTGIVSLRLWKKLFGEHSYAIYDGTHFMEESFVRTMLKEKIVEMLELC